MLVLPSQAWHGSSFPGKREGFRDLLSWGLCPPAWGSARRAWVTWRRKSKPHGDIWGPHTWAPTALLACSYHYSATWWPWTEVECGRTSAGFRLQKPRRGMGLTPAPCGSARPHLHTHLRLDSALLWRFSLLSGPLCAWPAGAPQMKPAPAAARHTEAPWKVLCCHLPCGLDHSSFLVFPLMPVSLHQPIFLQPHSTHGVAAQVFQGCPVACICHFCKPACPSWVLRTLPLAPRQPFASQSPCLGRAWKTYEGTLLAFPPIVLSPCRTSLSFRVWPWFPSSLDLSLISILLKSYSQFYCVINFTLNTYCPVSFLN